MRKILDFKLLNWWKLLINGSLEENVKDRKIINKM